MAVEIEILGSELGTEDPIINSGAIVDDGGSGTIPKGRSIAHNIFNDPHAVSLSFDIETANEIGIVCFKINLAKKKVGSDHADNILQVEDTFMIAKQALLILRNHVYGVAVICFLML